MIKRGRMGASPHRLWRDMRISAPSINGPRLQSM